MTDESERSEPMPSPDSPAQANVERTNGRFGPLGEPFNRRSPFWIGLGGGLGLAVAYLLWVAISSARGVLLLIALALTIAIGLDSMVALLERRGLPRWLGVMVVSLAAVAVFAAFLALAIPPIVDQVNRLTDLAPHYLQSLQSRSSVLGRLDRQFHLVRELRKALSSRGVGSGLVDAGQKALSVISGILIVVILTLYFL
ncbi:MAG: AI-2E family transporter, partial [Solirubrobacterales bacterium]|nr:AI-2E family transporter [Solirubrobacterales bacterium]